MENGNLLRRIITRVRAYSSCYGWGPRSPNTTQFCKMHGISRGSYYRLRKVAFDRIAADRIIENRRIDEWQKRYEDMIYSTTLWAGGYRSMTALEFRLAYNIPASTFYSYSLWGGKKSPSAEYLEECTKTMYPCHCLKRAGAGRYLKWYQELRGPLAGWWAGIKCEHCGGTGVIQSKEERCCVRSLSPTEAVRLLELEKKARVA